MYYSLGVLASAEVAECSASDFSTGFVGQASSKTMEQLRKGLGKVLFIDEAYQLRPAGGNYNADVLNEIVKALTTVEFKGKMVVILAGYEREMLQLLAANSVLSSRFTKRFKFEPFSEEDCFTQLEKQLQPKGFSLSSDYKTSTSLLMSRLLRTRDWGHGRDVDTLASNLATAVAQDNSIDPVQPILPVSLTCLTAVMQEMPSEEEPLHTHSPPPLEDAFPFAAASSSSSAPPQPQIVTATTAVQSAEVADVALLQPAEEATSACPPQ